MKQFCTMATLLQYLLKQLYPAELSNNIALAMQTVEQCNASDDNSSCVIITDTEAELQEVESKYNLKFRYPEADEYITADNQRWRKRVFVFDDFGSGIVLYSRSPLGSEKRTK